MSAITSNSRYEPYRATQSRYIACSVCSRPLYCSCLPSFLFLFSLLVFVSWIIHSSRMNHSYYMYHLCCIVGNSLTTNEEYILYVYVYAYVPLLILLHVPRTICTTRKHSRRIIDTSLHVLNYLHSVSVQRITNRHRTVKRSCFNGQCSRTFLACKIAEWACTNNTRMY